MSEHGHVLQNDLKKFYDNKHENEDHSKNAYNDEGYEKYNKYAASQKNYKRSRRPENYRRIGRQDRLMPPAVASKNIARRFLITRIHGSDD